MFVLVHVLTIRSQDQGDGTHSLFKCMSQAVLHNLYYVAVVTSGVSCC